VVAGSVPVGAAGGEGIKKSKKKIAGDKEKGLPSAKIIYPFPEILFPDDCRTMSTDPSTMLEVASS
jgi:hypothetical protein